MKINAQTARAQTDNVIEKEKKARRAYAEACVEEIIVPRIENAIERGEYAIAIPSKTITDYAENIYTLVLTILRENEYRLTASTNPQYLCIEW